MNDSSPLGIRWADYHLDRIYNAVEFLRIHGILEYSGFSIWDSCSICNLSAESWSQEIYLSRSALPLFPYYFINYWGGKDALAFWGPLLSIAVIHITSICLAEITVRCTEEKSPLTQLWIATSVFLLFSTSVWTYKMIRAEWMEVWFLLFFLLGVIIANAGRKLWGLFFLGLASFFHYQWGSIVGVSYLLTFLFLLFVDERRNGFEIIFPKGLNRFPGIIWVSIVLIAPFLLHSINRFVFNLYHPNNSGSSLLARIGISGESSDIHNGGLLGSIQFLGGNRITHCFDGKLNALLSGGSSQLSTKIEIFNCSLSILSLFFISTCSIFLFLLALKFRSKFRVFFVLALVALVFSVLLQQSNSAHLLGRSYVFGVFFAVGLTASFCLFERVLLSKTIRILILSPLFLAVVFTSIRVSMLSPNTG